MSASPLLECRLCKAPLGPAVVDLGATPLANSYLTPAQLFDPENYYPLQLHLCDSCALVQLPAVVPAEAIFSQYSYFSSFSTTLLKHSERFVQNVVPRLGLRPTDLVMEIASNDGYLLQYFRSAGLEVLGVEPAANVAAVAVEKGVPTVSRFFGRATAADLVKEGRRPRLLVANNVVAHVPDLNDFLGGMAVLLADDGTLSLEFHHLLSLVRHAQFDIIYHEHYQYFSLHTITTALAAHGLTVVDAEELATQGGSLRVYARHARHASTPAPEAAERLARIRCAEDEVCLAHSGTYHRLADAAAARKVELLSFLVDVRKAGQKVVGFGAAAKGNTLLNYAGVSADWIDYCVDSSPHKQGLCLPGSRIPIMPPSRVADTRPDYLLILPWNLRDEVMGQMSHVRTWGGRFVVPAPALEVIA
jgi:predicted TPR repeat methyltransferase